MSPDAIFAEPRLARIYDVFDGGRGDLEVYAALVDELGASTVLDVGCGTGTLAALLAARGKTVIGVDPAAASLDVARAKSQDVEWVHADATALPRVGADLAIMTGNVAQVFLTDEEWALVLGSVREALRPGGHFVFETRRPGARAWEEWGADDEPITRDGVQRWFELTDVTLPYVSFRYTYRFEGDGTVLTSDSTLRFRDRDQIEASLTAAGFRVDEVREAPDRPGREFVFLASTTGEHETEHDR